MPHKDSARALLCAVGLQLVVATPAQTADAADTPNTPSKSTQTIRCDRIGAKVGTDYHDDGLSLDVTEGGARLRCAFQCLDGQATAEGLWLTSTATKPPGDRFRVVATAVGRQTLVAEGTVTVVGQTVRLTRAGLVEEYSVSMDGVRQDFVVPAKPAGDGELKVRLAVSGARVEPAAYGAQLVLEPSGRKIAYSRLHVTDANGKELPAGIEAEPNSAFRTPQSEFGIAVVVNDAGAVYPLRIDPTFSDANWSALGSGMNNSVVALAVSGTNLYAGGAFTNAGGNAANYIAQWNGSSWSALGSGMRAPFTYSHYVDALAVSGGTLYAGGGFTNAGGNAANYIAQWNGSSWTPLGSGMNDEVNALAVTGGRLYAGGLFTMVGTTAAKHIAQWDGNSWAPLGPGLNGEVRTLAVSGGTLYVGGVFTTAGTKAVTYIAQWDGNTWSPLGRGMNGAVYALAVSNGTLYAGGAFTTADGNSVNAIAQWNGNNWSALGSGLWAGSTVSALAVSGGTLYVGGWFNLAGGTSDGIAQWTGNSWSSLGSGVNEGVEALAVSGGALYAGGEFSRAGTNHAVGYVAAAVLVWPEVQSGPVLNKDGSMTLTCCSGSNCSSRVYAATNLAPPVLWQPIYTNATGGLWQFTDTNASRNLEKFYRLAAP